MHFRGGHAPLKGDLTASLKRGSSPYSMINFKPTNAHGGRGINRKMTFSLSVSIEIELTSGFTFTFRALVINGGPAAG